MLSKIKFKKDAKTQSELIKDREEKIKIAHDAMQVAHEKVAACFADEKFEKYLKAYQDAEDCVFEAIFQINKKVTDPMEYTIAMKGMLDKLTVLRALKVDVNTDYRKKRSKPKDDK